MTWWIWLCLTNTKTISLEMKMLLPENHMFCDSNVIKQVKYNILSRVTSWVKEPHDFGTLMHDAV